MAEAAGIASEATRLAPMRCCRGLGCDGEVGAELDGDCSASWAAGAVVGPDPRASGGAVAGATAADPRVPVARRGGVRVPRGSAWTCGRIAKVIEEEFGVAHDKGHVSRLLRQLHWTPQMPVRRAVQRDEQAIEHWRSQTWPRLLAEARAERRTLVFVDEAGFYLLPSVVRTYAPEAHTPVLRAKLTRDHLSVMGGMTPAGRLYTLVRQESLNGTHSVEFLVHLMRVASERLLVIWDGSPIHRRVIVREFASDTRGKVRLEALPGYAPDLNPWDEGGWHHLKNVEMRNLVCGDLEQLHEEFYLALNRLRQKTWLVHSFFEQAGLMI